MNCAIPVVKVSFSCDVCGEEKTGKKHKKYDENWNFKGCYECEDCFEERLKG